MGLTQQKSDTKDKV